MNIQIVTTPANIDRSEWEEFVAHHPDGTIFQTPMMFESFQEGRNHHPFMFAALGENRIKAILSGVEIREYSGIPGKLTSRAIVWGGPIVERNNQAIAEPLLQAYNESISKSAIFSQFRNLSCCNWLKPVFESLGYTYEDHLNILIDLEKNEADLWSAIHGKRRNEIRRATKEKTVFSVQVNDESLRKGYDILREVYEYARLPLPDISLFKSVLAHSTDESGLKIFTAKNGGEMIGVMFALVFKKRIYDWYAGAYRSGLGKYPNDLIPWEVIRWGKARGYSLFDFGGAGKPNIPYGVRDYKLKFGGELVNYGRFEMIHQPLKMRLARMGFALWRSRKGKQPG